MHERRFHGGAERLRSPERIELLEINKVSDLCTKDKKINKVLDIGTGSGLFAEAFIKRGFEVTGIDVSDEMLSLAKNFVPSAKFKNAPAEKLPFEDKSFDLSFLGLVLHETDNLSQALNEAKRVTKQRIAVLEWPYSNGEQGPPLEHRIKPEIFDNLINETGFNGYNKIKLNKLELILLNS